MHRRPGIAPAQLDEAGIRARARDRIAEALGGVLVPLGRFGCIARAVAGL
jgi:hypothetical protein